MIDAYVYTVEYFKELDKNRTCPIHTRIKKHLYIPSLTIDVCQDFNGLEIIAYQCVKTMDDNAIKIQVSIELTIKLQDLVDYQTRAKWINKEISNDFEKLLNH